jgi:circadian clock protein KaiC
MPQSPRPSPPSEASAPEKLSTGIPGLDDVMAGGFPARHLFLIEGEPGTGKTTLGLQFLLEGARQGERGLYVTLSETKEELLGVATSHGWSADGIELFELIPPEEALRPEGQYRLRSLRDRAHGNHAGHLRNRRAGQAGASGSRLLIRDAPPGA